MRVLLDTTFARRGPSGTGVYIEHLAPALRDLGVEVVEAANERRRAPAGGGAGSWRNAAEDRRWSALELPRRAREAGARLIHHALPAAAPRFGAPVQVVTLHDLAFERVPEAFDPRFRAFARRAHRAAARRAGAVVCVSRTTAIDAVALWGVPPERIVVAPHGPGQEPPPRPDPPLAERHLLYVGDAEPRKNLDLLLAAYARFRAAASGSADPPPLVLAGGARAAGDGVRVEPDPSPARLAELYADAMALVHPALHEGFGMTALEAMHVGVPVLAARSPGVVETCADAAAYFDPRDPEALAGALARLAGDEAERRELARRGRERAGAFSWERSARAHVEAYTLALEQ
jgi:glycosyltransferase involved in cell wall biosynthesis